MEARRDFGLRSECIEKSSLQCLHHLVITGLALDGVFAPKHSMYERISKFLQELLSNGHMRVLPAEIPEGEPTEDPDEK
jgi:hypothetical protein